MKLWQYVVLTALSGATVWLAAQSRLRFLTIWPLLFLGEISYSLYLVHQVAGYWIISKFMLWGWNSYLAVLAATLVAIAVAICVRRFVEVPAQKSIRGYYRKALQTPVLVQTR